jgi:flagellar biosynthesis GTPase FlhF
MHETATNESYPTSGTIAPHNTHAQDPTLQQPYGARDPTNENHDKRNAAVLGGALGAAGLGGAAYVDSQHQDEREAEERLKKIAHDKEKEQHRLDKEQHKHDKEVHKHDKALAAHEKDEHHLAKEHEKEQARLAKEHEKEQARLAKEQHQREKELEKENEGEEKKKGGLLGFLHRDKSKKEKSSASPESSPRQSRDYSPRHSRDYGDDHPDSPRWKGKHLLHKDPPKGHPAREAMEHQQHQTDPYGSAGKREHVGVDGPIGDPNMISGDR